jgi:hypothetical protein
LFFCSLVLLPLRVFGADFSFDFRIGEWHRRLAKILAVKRHHYMKRIVPILVSAVILFGCSRSGDQTQSGDLGAFIIQHAQAFGAHPQTTALPALSAEWRYQLTSDVLGQKTKVTLDGNHIAELEPFLVAAFGPPVFPVTTNTEKGIILGLHGSDGVAVQFVCENAKDGKQYTKIEIQGPPKR